MRRATMAVLLLVLASSCGKSQPSDRGLVFEVVSVKPSPPDDGKRRAVYARGGPGTGDPGRFTGANLSLGNMLVRAYGIKHFQFVGPTWLDTERYDFVATVPKGATQGDIPLMLRRMLEQRFRLVAHHEFREMPIYRLVVGNSGSKLKSYQEHGIGEAPSQRDTPNSASAKLPVDRDGFPVPSPGKRQTMTVMTDGRPHMLAIQMSMGELAEWLTSQVDRSVIDATGLKGEFDFRLTWAIGEGTSWRGLTPPPAAGEVPAANGPIDSDAPTIFDAIREQLGLKLLQGKGRVDVLVIDHIEKTPTEN